jgi:hypothetical protein
MSFSASTSAFTFPNVVSGFLIMPLAKCSMMFSLKFVSRG